MKNKIRKLIITIIEHVLVLLLLFGSMYCIGYVMSRLVETVTAWHIIRW